VCSYRYLSQENKVKETVWPLMSKLVTDEEKDEVFNNVFASLFTDNLSPYPSPVDGLQDGYWGSKVPPTVREYSSL